MYLQKSQFRVRLTIMHLSEFYLFNLENNLYLTHPKYGKYKFNSLDEATDMLDALKNYLDENSLSYLTKNIVIVDENNNILNIFEK